MVFGEAGGTSLAADVYFPRENAGEDLPIGRHNQLRLQELLYAMTSSY